MSLGAYGEVSKDSYYVCVPSASCCDCGCKLLIYTVSVASSPELMEEKDLNCRCFN